MAIDTQPERISMLSFGAPPPGLSLLPDPAGSVGQEQRATLLGLFGTTIAAPAPPVAYGDHPLTTISTRAQWQDAWTTRDHLVPLRIQRRTAQAVSSAAALWQFGDVMRADESTYSQVNPLDIRRHWIKFEFTPETGTDPALFYGIVTTDEIKRVGSMADEYAGDQIIHVAGLEWLLSRVKVSQSVVRLGAGNQTINRGLVFNPHDLKEGNRSLTPVPVGSYFTFVENPHDVSLFGERWTATQAIEYLLGSLTYFDANGPDIALDSAAAPFLDWFEPLNVPTHNRSVFEVINQIISFQYGLTWWLDLVEADGPRGTIYVRVNSFARNDVVLPSSATLPRNNNQTSTNFNQAVDIEEALEITDVAERYEQIRAVGDFQGAVFTLSFGDATLEGAWQSTLETEYQSAAQSTSGYGALDWADKCKRNDVYRNSDRLRPVFTTYRPPLDWDLEAGNGIGGSTSTVFPTIDQATGDALTLTTHNVWREGVRFSQDLPLLTDRDYSSDPSDPDVRGELNYAQQRNMFVIFRLDDEADKWIMGDRLSALAENELSKYDAGQYINGFSFAVHVHPAENWPGIHVEPTGPAHLLGGDNWLGWWTVPTYAEYERGSEIYYERMAITVYAQCDAPVEAHWPIAPDPARHNQRSILYLRFGARARMDWMSPGTILDVKNDNTPVRAGTAGWIRNDFPWLQDVARTAWEWHSVERIAFRLSYAQLSNLFEIGQMITEIGAGPSLRTVNTVVSAITWDFRRGQTRVETQLADSFDVAELV